MRETDDLLAEANKRCYVDEEGRVRWKVVYSNKIKVGDIAGTLLVCGYMHISFFGIRVYAHRVAFAIHHGRWPVGFIDHIDRNKLNNRPINLRECTRSQNGMNREKQKNNKSGFLGVRRRNDTGKFVVEIMKNKKCVFRKEFETLEEAAQHRASVIHEYHGEFSNAP